MHYFHLQRIILLTSVILFTFLSGCTFKVAPKSQSGETQTKNLDDLKDAKWLSDEAYLLIQKNDFQNAIVKAELAVKKDPGSGDAHKNLALAYCESGRVTEALSFAKKAVALDPQSSKASFVLGKVFYKLGLYEESVPHLKEAVRLNPEYDKAYYLLAEAYDLTGRLKEANAALDRAVQLQPANEDYINRRETLIAYASQQTRGTLPTIKLIEGKAQWPAIRLYSSLFYEALLHRNFDFIDRAADEARESKEKLTGGIWKLQLIYAFLSKPSYPTSDYDWNSHIELLRLWVNEKPNSPTAQVALASGYLNFAWDIRGDGFADSVKQEHWPIFFERLSQAQAVLATSGNSPRCPKWYSIMQGIAVGAAQWDRSKYDRLYAEAIAFEPTWFEYHQQYAIYILQRWHGKPGEVETYLESLAVNPKVENNAIVYFLTRKHIDSFDKSLKHPNGSYANLKQGFLALRKLYGVTAEDQNYIFQKAKQSSDLALMQEISVETQGKVGSNSPLNKAQFDEAVRAFQAAKK